MKDGTARDKLETSKQSLSELEKNKNCPRGIKKKLGKPTLIEKYYNYF
jgi:hypothetical protein